MSWYFVFFVISGFCGVLYELVWLRLAMAQFGVTTAMVSIVLSVFMAGLGLGSWISGRWVRQAPAAVFPTLRIYALIELAIGILAVLVPLGLKAGRSIVEIVAPSSSALYYADAGLCVALVLLPGCTFMGATIPVAMCAIAQTNPEGSSRSFSYLYMANVGGAIAGTMLPLILIELLGFRGALRVGVLCNVTVATLAWIQSGRRGSSVLSKAAAAKTKQTAPAGNTRSLALLFLSGLTSMAMEVVWIRSYTPYLGTVVYAFASILFVYLLGTFGGSALYRRLQPGSLRDDSGLWLLVASLALLPLFAANPSVDMPAWLRLVLGLAPFTGLVGCITPMLVDRFSQGNPERAGLAYAINVLGCILGPLLSGFGLLPFLSERWALVLLTTPWIFVAIRSLRTFNPRRGYARWLAYASPVFVLVLVAADRNYDEQFPDRRVLRDPTATVVATGKGMQKKLLVNGYGMTVLTPLTKTMAHLPLSSLDHTPESALAICFGMGTTFRSLRSWGIPVTAVELVPSVPRLFDFYHADAASIVASPLSHIVIDDGRRYLERTPAQYDVITIDPPPPIEAAGSSMLYSEEFYAVARKRLRPGGILQQWLPAASADRQEVAAVTLAIRNSFPYVRAFGNRFGIHYLCSERPILNRTPEDLLQRMPAAAVADFVEWAPPGNNTPAGAYTQMRSLLSNELSLDRLVAVAPDTPALTDDRPINEYYVLRRWLGNDGAGSASNSQ